MRAFNLDVNPDWNVAKVLTWQHGITTASTRLYFSRRELFSRPKVLNLQECSYLAFSNDPYTDWACTAGKNDGDILTSDNEAN